MTPAQDARQHILKLIGAGRDTEAAALLQTLCANAPMNSEALYLLGGVHARQQQWTDAITALEQCVNLRPDIPHGHFALASALIAIGNLDAAAVHLDTALSIDRNMSEARLALAEILIARQDYDSAREHLRQALSSNPRLSGARLGGAHLGMGRLEMIRGAYGQAEPHLRNAVQHDPRSLPALCLLGSCLGSLGRHLEAEKTYRKALAVDPQHIEARSGLALVHEYLGNHAKAAELIESLCDKSPGNYTLALAFTRNCGYMGCCEEAIEYAEDTLRHPGLSKEACATLNFSVGKVLDRLGRYDESFAKHKAANDAVTYLYDAVGNAQLIDELIRVFSSSELQFNLPRSLNNDSRPLFIVGMPRSGTSLTEQILAAHPEVHAAGELRTLSDLVHGTCGNLGGREHFPLCVPGFTQADVDGLAKAYLRHLNSLSKRARRITDKMPHNFYLLGLIQLLFPAARIIHCTRDPLDTCLSIYFQDFSTGHEYARRLFDIGVHYHQYLRVMYHWRQVLSLPLLELRYEDLVTDPETLIRRMLDFCGLEWTDDCLRFHNSNRIIATASYDQVRQPLYSHAIGRWRHYERHLDDLKAGLARGY